MNKANLIESNVNARRQAMQTVTEQKNCLSAKLNRVFWCHDFKTNNKINFGKVNGQQKEMKRENESPKTMNSVAHNVLQLGEVADLEALTFN